MNLTITTENECLECHHMDYEHDAGPGPGACSLPECKCKGLRLARFETKGHWMHQRLHDIGIFHCDMYDMMSGNPIFTCSKCGALHPAVRVRRGNVEESLDMKADLVAHYAKADKLRAEWHKAMDRLFSPAMERFDNLSIPFEAMELERPKDYKAIQLAAIKAGAKYLETKTWDTWSVPDTLITVKHKGAHALQCADKCALFGLNKEAKAQLTSIVKETPGFIPVGRVRHVRYDGSTILVGITTEDGTRITTDVLKGASQKDFESAEKAWLGAQVRLTESGKWVRA